MGLAFGGVFGCQAPLLMVASGLAAAAKASGGVIGPAAVAMMDLSITTLRWGSLC